MGKFMKKSRVSEVSPHHPSLASGVLTRAKNLALQQQLLAQPLLDPSSLCYLQLRSRRRLHKLPPSPAPPASSRRQQTSRVGPTHHEEACCVDNGVGQTDEASFGENDPHNEEETSGRNTRESTPCSFIRETSSIATPGSTTRRAPSTSRGFRNGLLRDIPAMQEMEEFFALAEQQQQRLFLNKYNFDIANDTPIPGRFEWVRVV